jgi:hypothetical protein
MVELTADNSGPDPGVGLSTRHVMSPNPTPDWSTEPPEPHTWSGSAIVLIAIGTLAAGLFTVAFIRWNIHESSQPEFTETTEFALWVLLMATQVASWVFFFALLVRYLGLTNRAMAIRAPARSTRRTLWIRAFVFVLVVLVAFAVPNLAGAALGLQSEAPLWAHAPKSIAITVAGLAAAIPAMLVGSLSRDIAALDDTWPKESVSADLKWIGFLRHQFRTVIGVLSIEIAMLVLVTGALSKALATPGIETGNLSQSLVLAYGALFTVIVIAAYTYGRVAIDRRASKVLDQWTPLPERSQAQETAKEMKSSLDQRNALGAQLGLDVSLREGLGTTLLVGLPLISAFMSEIVGTKVI